MKLSVIASISMKKSFQTTLTPSERTETLALIETTETLATIQTTETLAAIKTMETLAAIEPKETLAVVGATETLPPIETTEPVATVSETPSECCAVNYLLLATDALCDGLFSTSLLRTPTHSVKFSLVHMHPNTQWISVYLSLP